MDEPAEQDAELARELFVELIREGILTPEIVSRVRQRFEAEAHHYEGNDRAGYYRTLARMADGLIHRATADDATTFRAGQRRRQLRIVQPDGGKGPD